MNDHILPLEKAFLAVSSTPQKTYLWDGIEDRGSLSIVCSQAKSGKTTFMEIFGMICSSNHSKFFGRSIISNKKVLYISLEEAMQPRIDRNKKQIAGLKSASIDVEPILKNYSVVNETFPRYLESKSSIKNRINAIENHKPDVLIIDSLSRMYTGKIEDSSEAHKVMKILRDIADNYQKPVFVIHHTVKLREETMSIHDIAGSRIIVQEVDNILAVIKTKTGKRYLKVLAYRYFAEPEKVYQFDIDPNSNIIFKGLVSESSLSRPIDRRVDRTNVDLLENYIKSNGTVSIKNLESHFTEGDNNAMSRATLFNNLKKLSSDFSCSNGQYTYRKQGYSFDRAEENI